MAQAAIQTVEFTLPPTLKISLVEDHAGLVRAVPDHIRQVLINLIQNSMKATEDLSTPKIEVRVENHKVVVSDNGIGMTDEVKKKVFQPFFTTFKKGSGLGLSICQRLMSFNGGSISIHSEVGVGTEVTLSFLSREGEENAI